MKARFNQTELLLKKKEKQEEIKGADGYEKSRNM